MSAFHPDLRSARWIPQLSFGPRTVSLTRLQKRPGPLPTLPDVRVQDIAVPATSGAPAVSLRLYQPKSLSTPKPLLYWMHGGGFVMGNPEQDEARNLALVRRLGISVAAVRYRRAPEHPAPAAVEDAYTGLRWLVSEATSLHIDATRIALGGASAGGGLAAALALVAHDRGEIRPAFQWLIYPMLDDRTVTRTDMDTRDVRVWTAGSNAWAWSVYLGHAPGAPHTSPYAAPARRESLQGLPPAWIGVGTLDLFHDEDVVYAERLREAGVPCALSVVPGAFHGFDVVFPTKPVTRAFWEAQVHALGASLGIDTR